jgi:MFS family permease
LSGAGKARGDRVTYADIFAVREFRALFISRGLSTIGDYLARAALTIAVFVETGSTALMGITFALTLLPDLIGGPLLGSLADRFPRRAVMVASDVGRALLLLVMAIPGLPLFVLWALLFAIRLMDGPFLSAYHSSMAVVLPGKQQLVKGTAVSQLVNHVAYTVGYGLGGLTVGLTGLSVVLVLNAGTFVVSGVVIMLGLLSRPATANPDAPPTLLGAARAATRYIAGHPRLRVIMLFPFPIAISLVCETLAAPYAAEIGHGSAVAGLLMGAAPAGIVLGLWILPMIIPDQRSGHVMVLSIMSCVPLVLFVGAPGPVVAAILVVASGLPLYFWIPLSAEFAQTVPDEMRGQAMGLMTTTMKVTQGVAILSFGLIAQTAMSSTVIAVSGAIGTAMMIGLSIAWIKAGRPAKVTPATPEVAPGPAPTRGEAVQ